MTVRFFGAAREEMLASALYLQQQETGLGDRFLDAIDRALVLIEQHPQAWSPMGRGLRCCRLAVFRYGLIYRVRASQIEVVAVAHDRRRPGYWRNRLRTVE